MKKTKKALLAAVACSAVLAGAFGLTACNKGGDNSGDKHDHSWGNWTVTDANKPTATATGKATRTCSGEGTCDAAATDKEYTLPALTSSDYTKGADSATCSAAGSVQYTYNKDGVNVSFSVATPVNSTAHKYGDYVEKDATSHYKVCEYNPAHTSEPEAHDTNGADGGCSVCGYNPNHEHTFDETVWDKDETGHWHPTNCGHDLDIKDSTSGFAAHVYGDWTVTTPATETTEGVESHTCTVEGCGYVATRTIAKLPKAVTGGEDEDTAKTLTAGRYSVVIDGENVENWPGHPEYGSYFVGDQFYFEVTAGEEAKKYTISLENEKGYIATSSGDTVIESVDVILEPGESYVFSISVDEVENEGGDTIIFAITESEPPVKGSLERPISFKNGLNGTTVEDDEQKVYFKLDHNVFNGKNVNITLGQGVTLYSLGANWDDIVAGEAEATKVEDGVFETSEWYDNYFYAESRNRDGECNVTVEIVYKDGDKEKPIVAKSGTGDENVNSVDGNADVWFKLEAPAGRYIIKSTSTESTLGIYNDVDGRAVTEVRGSAIVFTIGDTPVFIKTNTNYYGEFTFTVTQFTDADKGTVASEPLELTGTGAEFDVPENALYFKFTAPTDAEAGMLMFVYGNGNASYSDSLSFEIYSDATFENVTDRSGNSNRLGIDTEAGETYYIKVEKQWNTAGTKFRFSYGEFANHDYVITVTDGAEENATLPSGVTVTLTDSEGKELTTTTTDGVATFTGVDPTKEYVVSLSGLPEGFGYYNTDVGDLTIARNIDTTTNFTVNIVELNTYTVTVTGADAGVDLSGIEITINAYLTGTFTAETNAEGVATFKVLPPFNGSSYQVSVKVPEELAQNYVYVPQPNKDLSISDLQPTVEVPLSKFVTYIITVNDEDGNALPEGTRVTINNVSGIVGADGKVLITTAAGVYDITISDDYVTSTKTDAENFEFTIVCEKTNAPVNGADSVGGAAKLNEGVTPYNGASYYCTYGAFTSEEGGTYVISMVSSNPGATAGFDEAYHNNTQVLSYEYDEETYESKYVPDGTVITNVVKGSSDYYATGLTVTLGAGESIVLGIYGTGNLTIAKA